MLWIIKFDKGQWLHHVVQRIFFLHLTRDMWHMAYNKGHMTHNCFAALLCDALQNKQKLYGPPLFNKECKCTPERFTLLQHLFYDGAPGNKHRKNPKTLPCEHHIGCQMCQIVLSKNIRRVKRRKKIVERLYNFYPYCHNCKKCIYFLNTFRQSNLTYLTTDVMISGQRFANLAMFCLVQDNNTNLFFLLVLKIWLNFSIIVVVINI